MNFQNPTFYCLVFYLEIVMLFRYVASFSFKFHHHFHGGTKSLSPFVESGISAVQKRYFSTSNDTHNDITVDNDDKKRRGSSPLRLSVEEIEASLGPNRKIVTKPFSWKELTEIVKFGDPTMHSRSLQVQEEYIFHVKEVKQEWKSMNDYILYSKFNFQSVVQNDGKKCAKPTLEEARSKGIVMTRLLLNEFPYYCEDGIEHYCLWKLGGPINKIEIENALDDLRNMKDANGTLEDVLYWVNPKHLQSIPDIDHAHFLCLRGTQHTCSRKDL